MKAKRQIALQRNFSALFWTKALINLKIINIVIVLFYLHRGITLSEVFLLSIVWSITSILGEVPSSYMADKWGRKRTIIIGVIFFILSHLILLFAFDITIFIISTIFLSLSFAAFSGTDEALVYDTAKELGREKKSLRELGKLASAKQIFKIFAPIAGAIIARELTEVQFITLIIIDIIVSVGALISASRITEPNHYVDVEKQEAGVIMDAWKLLTKNKHLTRMILNKTLIFIAIFIVWRFHQKFFIDIDLSIIALGIGWSAFHLFTFIAKQKLSHIFPSKPMTWRINLLNNVVLFGTILFIVLLFIYPQKYLLLTIFLIIDFAEILRWPLFSEMFNKHSLSHNRATTLSLTNFLKSVLDIPLLLIGAAIIAVDITYPFYLSLIIIAFTIIFFRLRRFKIGKIKM